MPSFDHIFVVIEENHSTIDILYNPLAPYLNALAKQYALATNYYALTSPSLPNYLALIGGSTFGITTDCTDCFVDAPTLVERIESSGRTWKAYMESMPQPCFLGDVENLYAQKHNPFIYFDAIRNDAERCSNIVPYTQLADDLTTTDTTPDFVWITPNLCNDMHNCDVDAGDDWLKRNLPLIFTSPAWQSQESVLFITWDEGYKTNQVVTFVIGRSVKGGYRSAMPYNHYSLLRTIEDAWRLAPLTSNDQSASAMSDFW